MNFFLLLTKFQNFLAFSLFAAAITLYYFLAAFLNSHYTLLVNLSHSAMMSRRKASMYWTRKSFYWLTHINVQGTIQGWLFHFLRTLVTGIYIIIIFPIFFSLNASHKLSTFSYLREVQSPSWSSLVCDILCCNLNSFHRPWNLKIRGLTL